MKNNQNPNPFTNQIRRCADILHAKGPRLIAMRSHEMRDGTTMHATCAPCPVKDARGYAKASGERYRLTAGNKPCSVKSLCTKSLCTKSLCDKTPAAFFNHPFFPQGKNADAAESPVVSTILLIAVTVALCAAVLVFCLGFFGGVFDEEQVPEILKITGVSHHSDGRLTYAGIVSLINAGDSAFENKKFGAYLYVNGGDPKAVIETLNAHDFIPTHHRAVKLIRGGGPSDTVWDIGDTGFIDFIDRLIMPGDTVRIDVFERDSGKVVSRSEYKAPLI